MQLQNMSKLEQTMMDDADVELSEEENQPFIFYQIEDSKEKSNRMFIVDFFKRLSLSSISGVLGILGAILIVIGVVFVVYMGEIIKYIILKESVLSRDNAFFDTWQNPDFPVLFEIHIFNISNYKEFAEHKAKPILKELGPYVYSQNWYKNKIVFNDNDTVTYVQNKTYYFEPQLSKGSEDDIVFTLNFPMLTGANMFKHAGPVLKVVMTTVFSVTHESLVVNSTVRNLIWDGWDDPILKALHQILPNSKYPFTRFAYFYGRNGSDEGQMTVNTGKSDSKRENEIDTWNGLREMKVWPGEKCNKIRGTPGDLFHPDRDKVEPIEFFYPLFCRSVSIPYSKEVERFGIKTYRFETDSKLFANGSENPENACYCHKNCLPSGAVDVGSCAFDAPIAVSLPHFLFADPRYLKQVSGLKPNKTLHNIYADVEPKTGITVDVNIRMQLNAILENIPGISQFEHVNNTVFPILWVTQTLKLTPDILQLIRIASSTAYMYGDVLTYSIIIMGCVLIVIAPGYYFYKHRSSKNAAF